MYLSFKPTKAAAFKVYFEANMLHTLRAYDEASKCGRLFFSPATLSNFTFSISKDGAAFTSLTNAPIEIDTGHAQVQLTATEMNADVIIIKGLYQDLQNVQDSYTGIISIIIYTSTATDFNLTSIVTDVTDLSHENPTVQEVLSLLWMGLRKSGGKAGWSFNKWVNRYKL